MKKHLPGRNAPWVRGMAALCMALWLGLSPLCALADARLMVVSDLHYLEPSLYRGSELFIRVLRGGDGKITQCGEELLDALAATALLEQPDALIVTGDLSYNGEKKSHEALARRFAALEAAGIPVWVIPGNHDINTASPLGFGDGMVYGTEGTSPEDFQAIYADFMEPGTAGFSYAAKIGDPLWIAMTDVSVYRDGAQTPGFFTSGHAAWLEEVLKAAREEGVCVVTATHHSLIAHTQFFRESYLMFGSEAMRSLAAGYGVRLNLSGHLHIQHIARDEDLADAALGAFCMWPHRYALVTLEDDGALTCDARALDESLLPEGFSEMSREWFAGIAAEKAGAALDGPAEETGMMAEYAARFNMAYFSGTYKKNDPSWKEDMAYALWAEYGDTAFLSYMKTVMEESSGDNLHLEIR